MPAARNEYFIIYDIANDRRLHRVARILGSYGQRTQKSKFAVSLTRRELRALQQELGRVIHPEEDGIKYFPLCEKCFGKIEMFGLGHKKGHDSPFEIV